LGCTQKLNFGGDVKASPSPSKGGDVSKPATPWGKKIISSCFSVFVPSCLILKKRSFEKKDVNVFIMVNTKTQRHED